VGEVRLTVVQAWNVKERIELLADSMSLPMWWDEVMKRYFVILTHLAKLMNAVRSSPEPERTTLPKRYQDAPGFCVRREW